MERRPIELARGTLGDRQAAYEKGWGYCQCGCGKRTKIVRRAFKHFADGKTVTHIEEYARRFVVGHSAKTAEFRSAQSKRASEQVMNAYRDPFDSVGRSVAGTYFSMKLNRNVNFMSSYERRAFEILEGMKDVDIYEEQPFTIPYAFRGTQHVYIPDILVTLGDGSRVLIEVKPKSRLNSEHIKAKHEAAEIFCRNRGWTFEVWTEALLTGNGAIAPWSSRSG